jgi:hypothetical protein
MVDQQPQNLKRLFLQKDVSVFAAWLGDTQLTGLQVELERSEPRTDWLPGFYGIWDVSHKFLAIFAGC